MNWFTCYCFEGGALYFSEEAKSCREKLIFSWKISLGPNNGQGFQGAMTLIAPPSGHHFSSNWSTEWWWCASSWWGISHSQWRRGYVGKSLELNLNEKKLYGFKREGVWYSVLFLYSFLQNQSLHSHFFT